MGWLGRTFCARNPHIEHGYEHLVFVITDGDGDEDELVLVAMTSHPTESDVACILVPNDPECRTIPRRLLNRPSAIAYKDTMVCTVETLARAINNGGFKDCARVPLSLVWRIQDGALASADLVHPKALPLIQEAVGLRPT